jgi:hypothetical protein
MRRLHQWFLTGRDRSVMTRRSMTMIRPSATIAALFLSMPRLPVKTVFRERCRIDEWLSAYMYKSSLDGVGMAHFYQPALLLSTRLHLITECPSFIFVRNRPLVSLGHHAGSDFELHLE